MITFLHPWVFALVLLPLILWAVLPAYREAKQAVRVPWFQRVVELIGGTPSEGAVIAETRLSHRIFLYFFWILLVSSLARTHFVEPALTATTPPPREGLLGATPASMEAMGMSNKGG